jgi:membrane-bound inhibitor of C-type lysozyme
MRPALLLLLLAGCAAVEMPRPVVFACPGLGEVTIRHGDRAEFRFGGRSLTLPRAMAASGVRYAEGATEFWEKGGEAVFTVDGKRIEGCRYLPSR